MKRALFLLVALFTASTTAMAQKLNVQTVQKQIAKAGKFITTPKSKDANKWISYGDICAQYHFAPTATLYVGSPQEDLLFNLGSPQSIHEEYSFALKATASIFKYDFVDVYIVDGIVLGWSQNNELAYKSILAYEKAYDIDKSIEATIFNNVSKLAKYLEQQAYTSYNVGCAVEAAQTFDLAYRAQQILPSIADDGSLIYNTGIIYLAVADKATTKNEAITLLKKSEAALCKALNDGYMDEECNIYYKLYSCYYGQLEADSTTYIAKAKEALISGFKRCPQDDIYLKTLLDFAQQGVVQPVELIQMIETALKKYPQNPMLWFRRGSLFFDLANYDEAICSFKKMAELTPNNFAAYSLTGLAISLKAEAELTRLSEEPIDADRTRFNTLVAEAIVWLEKAHELNPNDESTIEYLKSLCFHLRNQAGMEAKYQKYRQLSQTIREH